jgi:hypothetical protein
VSVLRPITSADHPQVLAWNQQHVELLSPLDEARLSPCATRPTSVR